MRKVICYSPNLIPQSWNLDDVIDLYENKGFIIYDQSLSKNTTPPHIIEVDLPPLTNQQEIIEFLDISKEEDNIKFKTLTNK